MCENYRAVSIFPVFSKILEKLVYNALVKHFLDNNIIFCNQSGFKPGDSYINQLIVISHDVFKVLMMINWQNMAWGTYNYVVKVFVAIY